MSRSSDSGMSASSASSHMAQGGMSCSQVSLESYTDFSQLDGYLRMMLQLLRDETSVMYNREMRLFSFECLQGQCYARIRDKNGRYEVLKQFMFHRYSVCGVLWQNPNWQLPSSRPLAYITSLDDAALTRLMCHYKHSLLQPIMPIVIFVPSSSNWKLEMRLLRPASVDRYLSLRTQRVSHNIQPSMSSQADSDGVREMLTAATQLKNMENNSIRQDLEVEKEKNSELNNTLKGVRKALSQKKGEMATLKAKLEGEQARKRRQLEESTGQLNALRKTVVKYVCKAKVLEKSVADLTNQLAQERKAKRETLKASAEKSTKIIALQNELDALKLSMTRRTSKRCLSEIVVESPVAKKPKSKKQKTVMQKGAATLFKPQAENDVPVDDRTPAETTEVDGFLFEEFSEGQSKAFQAC